MAGILRSWALDKQRTPHLATFFANMREFGLVVFVFLRFHLSFCLAFRIGVLSLRRHRRGRSLGKNIKRRSRYWSRRRLVAFLGRSTFISTLLPSLVFVHRRFVTIRWRQLVGHSVIMTATKVTLGHRSHAVRTIAKLDTAITTSKVGANEIFTVLGIFGNDEVSSLEIVVHWHASRTAGNNHCAGGLSKILLVLLGSGSGWLLLHRPCRITPNTVLVHLLGR
mmetsp:Transcript_93320/g.260945  ORF Transcript_93320/g.260945 Transcript_93320/m.260945 type:complete len:223 (+) Transcript_93320:782-1450(+)